MINLYALSYADLKDLVVSLGEQPYRARQLWHWLYERRVATFSAMTNLPKALLDKLNDSATLGSLELAARQLSRDGTEKRLYRLHDGQLIESVLMPYSDNRKTACISSQAGCAMGCVFCATGQMGFGRNLSAAEIFEQAIIFARELAAPGTTASAMSFSWAWASPFTITKRRSKRSVRQLMSTGWKSARVTSPSARSVWRRRYAASLMRGLQVKLG